MTDKRLVTVRVIFTALSIAAICSIFYNSSLDATQSSAQSGSLLDAVNAFLRSLGTNLVISDHLIRKAAHFVEYLILGGLLACTVYVYIIRVSVIPALALPLGALVAVCDELIQLGSAGRSCEVGDMLLDFSGVLCATVIVWFCFYITNVKKKEGRNGE